MSTRPWLVVSIGLNLFAAAALYVALRPMGEITPVPGETVENGSVTRTNVVVRHENFTWSQVESTNYSVFIKNLRAIECPEQTIRDIIVSEVTRWYDRRKLEEVVYPNFQWWLSDPDDAAVETAARKVQALDAERRALLSSLLGPNWDPQSSQAIAARGGITLTGPILGDLPSDKKQTVYDIAARAQLKIEAYQAGQTGKTLDPMELVRLRNEPLGQLAAVLTPAQYLEYLLRYSPSADQEREQLRSLSVTPDQFRSLFTALNPINGQPLFYYAGSDAELAKQRDQLQAQSDAIIRTALGEQTYAAYQLNRDSIYRASLTTARELGLAETVIMPIYEINRATQAESDRIRKDATLSNDEKIEALSQAAVEQQESLEQILGPEAFGRWLQARSQGY